jgi:hypothetical protein
MKDFFRQNILCNTLHDHQNIWFCKYEHLSQDIETIRKINNKIKLIVGNTDECFTISDYQKLPKNISHVFASNSICSDNKNIFSLPLGIESSEFSKRNGHGIGFDMSVEKETNILRVRDVKPEKYKNLILANFSLQTNYPIRLFLINHCINNNHISVQKNNLSYFQYYNEVSNHRSVLCPIGNGLDTVRTYETIYCNRVPIIFGSDIIYKELFFDLPCVYLKNIDDLKNENEMIKKIEEAEKKFNNTHKVYLKHWTDKIKTI